MAYLTEVYEVKLWWSSTGNHLDLCFIVNSDKTSTLFDLITVAMFLDKKYAITTKSAPINSWICIFDDVSNFCNLCAEKEEEGFDLFLAISDVIATSVHKHTKSVKFTLTF